MLFKCRPPGTPIPGRFPGPGACPRQWFTIDIHCHVRSDKAAAMVEGNDEVSRWFLETAGQRAQPGDQPAERRAHPHRRAPRPSSGSPTWTGWGSTSRRSRRRRARPITAPTPISGSPPSRVDQRRSSPRSAAAIPTALSGSARCRSRRPSWRVAELDRLHKSLGFRGIEIMTHVAGEDLSADRFRQIFARCEELGLLVFMHSDGFTEARPLPRPLLQQCDRQPARHDGRPASPDLWRRARRLSRPEAGRWRMAAAICRPIPGASTTPPRRAGLLRAHPPECRRPI